MSMLNGKLRAHDVDDLEALTRKALNDELRRRGATLTPQLYDECLIWLLVDVAWAKLVPSYRKELSGKKPSFNSYAYSILRRRVTDWFRTQFGDSRAEPGVRPELIPLDSGGHRLDESFGQSEGHPGEDCGADLLRGALETGNRLGLGALEGLDKQAADRAAKRSGSAC